MGEITKKLVSILIVVLFISRCANQLPPGGGEVDRIPPEIIEVYPPNGTTNYEDDYFEIEFSEYVDKRSFKDALFISPNIEGRLIYEWTGTSISVEFAEGLKDEITYTVTVGTDLVDRNNKNRMASSYTFSFSTGNTIDRRTISGSVFSEEQEGVLIYAYRIDEGVDTILNRKPDYVSQTGNNGKFQLNGLGEADYRLFAVKDEYRDLIYDLDLDLIGLPNQDISLTGSDTSFTDIKFKMFKADTTAPRLLKGIMTDEKHILLTLSEFIDKEQVKADNYSIMDSTTDQQSKVSFVFRRYGKNDEVVLIPETQLQLENQTYLIAKALKDTVGNKFINDFVLLTVSDRPDTTAINVVGTIPKNSNSVVDFNNTIFKFYFDDAFEKKDIQRSITFTDTLDKGVPFNISFDDDAALVISPVKSLLPEKDYIIKLDLNKFVDAAGNRRDSIYIFRFSTSSGLDYTGVSGKIIHLNFNSNPILVLENVENKAIKYQQAIIKEDFNFTEINKGKYLLWCYMDVDSNYQYSYGWPKPFTYSEVFSVYSDTLKLKPRWEITDVLFDFK